MAAVQVVVEKFRCSGAVRGSHRICASDAERTQLRELRKQRCIGLFALPDFVPNCSHKKKTFGGLGACGIRWSINALARRALARKQKRDDYSVIVLSYSLLEFQRHGRNVARICPAESGVLLLW